MTLVNAVRLKFDGQKFRAFTGLGVRVLLDPAVREQLVVTCGDCAAAARSLAAFGETFVDAWRRLSGGM